MVVWLIFKTYQNKNLIYKANTPETQANKTTKKYPDTCRIFRHSLMIGSTPPGLPSTLQASEDRRKRRWKTTN